MFDIDKNIVDVKNQKNADKKGRLDEEEEDDSALEFSFEQEK